jgi:hypothetical protein
MSIKVNVKLKFQKEADLRVVESVARSVGMDLREFTSRAVLTYTNAVIEAAKNRSNNGPHDAVPTQSAGTLEDGQHSETPRSAALPNAEAVHVNEGGE